MEYELVEYAGWKRFFTATFWKIQWARIVNGQPPLNIISTFTIDTKEDKMSPIMEFFEYEHLPETLQAVSRQICELAREFDRTLPDCAEKSVGLRKLLEAKDALVRASL